MRIAASWDPANTSAAQQLAAAKINAEKACRLSSTQSKGIRLRTGGWCLKSDASKPEAARDWFRQLFDDDDGRLYTLATLVPADRRVARARVAVGAAATVGALALALRRRQYA